jgi:hypothetical protein
VLAAGGEHSMALAFDGTVWTFGRNQNGQLGDGTFAAAAYQRTSPAPVAGLTQVIAVAAGYCHSVALRSDGTVWSWGCNNAGQLGINTLFDAAIPTQVPGLVGVQAIATGNAHTLARLANGTLWAWGKNLEGELGNNSFTNSAAPVQVIGLTGVVDMAGGEWHSVARRVDGTIWTWGRNQSGQLGPAAGPASSIPVLQVPVSVAVSPATAGILTGQTQTFTASVTGAFNTAVIWTVDEATGGIVSPTGVYTAPAIPGTYHVTATSAVDGSATSKATVTVSLPPLWVSGGPADNGRVVVKSGSSGGNPVLGATVQVFLDGSSTPYETFIESTTTPGQYDEPAGTPIGGNHEVKIVVTVGTQQVTGICVMPFQPTLTLPGTPTGAYTSTLAGGTQNAIVSWSVLPDVQPAGTVYQFASTDPLDPVSGPNVNFWAYVTGQSQISVPFVSGHYHLIFMNTWTNATMSGPFVPGGGLGAVRTTPTYRVDVTPAPTVVVTPATAGLQIGQTQSFSATFPGMASTAVSWAVQETNGGSISAAGLYTAPATAGIYHVIATSVADPTRTIATTVTVTMPVWTAGASMTFPRFQHAAGLLNGKITVVGGYNPGYLAVPAAEAYAYSSNAWSSAGTASVVGFSSANAQLGSTIWLLGGDSGSSSTVSNRVQSYDLSSSMLTAGSPLGLPRSGASAVAVVGSTTDVLVMGGQVAGQVPMPSTVERFTFPASGSPTVTTKTPMPTPRRWMTAAALPNGKIYAIGGFVSNAVATVEVYDPGSDTWVSDTPLPIPLFSSSAVVRDGLIYVIGGTTTGASMVNVVYVFNPATHTWSSGPTLPDYVTNSTATVVGNVVYVVGGQRGTTAGAVLVLQ